MASDPSSLWVALHRVRPPACTPPIRASGNRGRVVGEVNLVSDRSILGRSVMSADNRIQRETRCKMLHMHYPRPRLPPGRACYCCVRARPRGTCPCPRGTHMLPFRTLTAKLSIHSRRSLPGNSQHSADNALLHEMSTDGEWFESETRGTYAQFSLNRSEISVSPSPNPSRPRPNHEY